MLTSITPLGERGRGQHWWITAGFLGVGHAIGGAVLGVCLALIGQGLGLIPGVIGEIAGGAASERVTVLAVSSAAVGGLAFDLNGWRVPGRRQVDERWLTSYRGWVYGIGFGAQLGFGIVTVVNTALLAAVLVAGVMVSPVRAGAIGLFYGMIRGGAAVSNGWVSSVGGLHRLHRLLDDSERRAHYIVLTVVGLVSLGSMMMVMM